MTDPDDDLRWLAEHMPPEPPADLVPRGRRRPSRDVVTHLLALDPTTQVTMTNTEFVEDVDGLPLGVRTTTTAATMARPSLTQLGWTQAEWDDPSVTE